MAYNTSPSFRKHLIALAACSALAPTSTWALDLASGPPGTKEPYVAPNVILSLDDSTSMNAKDMIKVNGKWTKTRTEVLADAVIDVFKDTNILADGKIRFAWQTMGNCTAVNKEYWAPELDAKSGTNKNSMRPLQGDHRANFLKYMENYKACTNTPTHLMVKRAHEYMAAKLHKNGPWATKPGQNSPEYLGCRRNYHILLTDGGWNAQYQDTSPLNYDGTARTLPDGTDYDPNASETKIFSDKEDFSTIADWAFYSWSTSLQSYSDLDGKVQPSSAYRKAPSKETFTNRVTKTTTTLDRFWNPRYDPATWPHLVTYTIGFSADALPQKNYNTKGTDMGAINSPTTMLPYGFDGDFAEYAKGSYQWRAYQKDKGHDMWHAALNGRGEFYAVEKGEDLKKAFESIIGSINTETMPDVSSTATSGSNASRYDIGSYTGAYEPLKAWRGYVTAKTVDKDGKTTDVWGGKNTGELLDALPSISNRLILSWSDNWVAKTNGKEGEAGGVSFKWANDQTYLSTAQKAKLGQSTATPVVSSGEKILNFIRGDRSLEGSDANTPFRVRTSRQGDIINSGVWYVGPPAGTYALQGYSSFVRSQSTRTPMLYVGGNDGMLHAFSATDGSEKMAYVPRGIIASLKSLASPSYNHQYFVDGSPMTGDVEIGGVENLADGTQAYIPDWRTLLVGTLGAGGKGYFVLDATNPAAGSSSKAAAFAEANANSLVRLDRTRGTLDALDCTSLTDSRLTACTKEANEDKDIGYITAKPVLDENNPMRTTQITRMNDGRWAVVMGNGYNSTNQRPVLLIQYLDQGQELIRIPVTAEAAGTGNANDNGLSAPRLIDLNGDGRADIAYAGDNLGNLWKFDLTSKTSGNWGVAFTGKPLFTALGPSSLGSSTRPNAQPITVTPTARANDRMKTVTGADGKKKDVAVGGMMVAFGTGRNVSTDDPNDIKVQSIYSVLDNTRYRVSSTSGFNQWLEVHPGKNCGSSAPANCQDIPAPAALGTGVTSAKLAKREIAELTIAGAKGGRVNEVDTLDKTTWGKTYNGWYIDLPAVGERSLKNLEMYDNSNILVAYTQVPAKGSDVDVSKESCGSTTVDLERQYRTMLNIMDGKRPSIQLINMGSNTSYSASDNQDASRAEVDKGSHSQVAGSDTEMLDLSTCKGEKCLRDSAEKMLRMPEQSLRPSWRQLQ
ncbi:MAG: PilC/PilY family type IV pilus protein [Comamonas sp.]